MTVKVYRNNVKRFFVMQDIHDTHDACIHNVYTDIEDTFFERIQANFHLYYNFTITVTSLQVK